MSKVESPVFALLCFPRPVVPKVALHAGHNPLSREQGISNAVGLAIAERHLAARFNKVCKQSRGGCAHSTPCTTHVRRRAHDTFAAGLSHLRQLHLRRLRRWLPAGSHSSRFSFKRQISRSAQEGVSAEAGSMAGHLGLGKLIVLYDDNLVCLCLCRTGGDQAKTKVP